MQHQSTPTHTAASTPIIRPVTFRQFAALAKRRSLTAQALADRFRGRIENPTEFFAAVLSEKRPDVFIVYRSVLQFYAVTLASEPPPDQLLCACGCGEPVFDRKKWAKPGCRKRTQRKEVRDRQKWVRQLADFVDSKVGQNRRMATLPLPGTENANLSR